MIAESVVQGLLDDARLGRLLSLARLPGGGNNQVYKVQVESGSYLLKAYFHHPDDKRPRLRAEFSLCAFLHEIGISAAPRPIAADKYQHLGLYEFIEGEKPDLQAISADDVSELIGFFKALNSKPELARQMMLPAASEAFVTLGAHLNCVEERLLRLENIQGQNAVDSEARELFEAKILPALSATKDAFAAACAKHQLDPQQALSDQLQILSPSDFGFHNSIRRQSGELVFLDFEYAGWDDAAKMLCDLYWQQAFRLSADQQLKIQAAVFEFLSADRSLRARTEILLPVYRLKWVSIVLNHFAPLGQARRVFAASTEEVQARKEAQLDKARRLLSA